MRELICFGEITLDTIGSSGWAAEGAAVILDDLGTS